MKPLSQENGKTGPADVASLCLLWVVLYVCRLDEAQLKMDAMTYGALAKHMLSSGDWATPHYTPSAYPDFFQHPPLMLWMQAIVFKFFGATAAVARLLPSYLALATILGVYLWARRATDRFGGFAAALVLLLSFTYLKYASDFILDGPLACFLVWGSIAFLEIERRRSWLMVAAFAVALASALLTKGLVGFSLPLTAFTYALFSLERRRLVIALAAGCAGAALLLCPWLFLGNGVHYVTEYLRHSVTGRTSAVQFMDRFAPLVQLAKTYAPWFPLLIAAGVVRGRVVGKEFFRGPIGFAWMHALVILGAFSYVGHFLEHYLVPFYPMAAVAMAPLLSTIPARFHAGVRKTFIALAVLALAILTFWPHPIRTQRKDPIRTAARWVAEKCPDNRGVEVLVTTALSEKWLALASVLWETNAEARSVSTSESPGPNQILLTAVGEPAPAEGRLVVEDPYLPFRAYLTGATCREK